MAQRVAYVDERERADRLSELPVCKRTNAMGDSKTQSELFYDQSTRRQVSIASNGDYTNSNSLQKIMADSLIEEGKNCYSISSEKSLKSSMFTKKVRFIKKSGHCNVSHVNLSDKSRRFIADIFTTGVDLQWRWNLVVFSMAFVISWTFFGLIFWLSSYLHGDFELYPNNHTHRACIRALDPSYPFTSTFLFSLETQTTIGYGFRVVTEECPFTVLLVVLQSVFGCILDAFMIGLIMAKISRPKKRAETLLFSDHAVVNMRDGKLCLMVRVGNLRKSHLVEATIRMQYVYSRQTIEGEFIPLEQVDLNLDLKNDSDRLFLVTPQTISHPIDADSPLWGLHPKDLQSSKFEIIVILEGMVEATGMTTQARASYLPCEILWGHRFDNMISLTRNNAYKVNFNHFHSTHLSQDAPTKSAKELHEASKANIRTLTDGGVTMRSRRACRAPSSNSSSARSSVQSSRHIPSSASDGRDSGYTAVEDLPRSPSNHSLGKPLTSTTSLSDEADDEQTKAVDVINKQIPLPGGGEDPLIDLSSPKAFEETSDGKANTNLPGSNDGLWSSGKSENGPVESKKLHQAPSEEGATVKPSKDIKLLLLASSNGDATHEALPNGGSVEFDETHNKGFGHVQLESNSSLCA